LVYNTAKRQAYSQLHTDTHTYFLNQQYNPTNAISISMHMYIYI